MKTSRNSGQDRIDLPLGRFADPTSDAGFKAIFCDEANLPMVVGLLNIILPKKIAGAVHAAPSERHTRQAAGKGIRVDLHCTDEEGNHFIVEMQASYQHYFGKRVVYYASMTYEQQLRMGDDYSQLHPVYQISFVCDDMKFCRTAPGWQERYIAEYSLTEKEAGDVIADTIYVIFVELYRFNKTLDECRTDAELLMWTLKNQKTLEDIPVKLKGIPPIVSLLESAEVANFSEGKYNDYIESMLTELDNKLKLQAKWDLGREVGLAEGKAEGLAEGEAIGEARKSEEIARKLKTMGMSIADISVATGLPQEAIETL